MRDGERRVKDLWFVSLDTIRLRRALVGVRARVATRACAAAAAAARVRLVHSAVLPFGVRAVVETRDRRAVRAFARRFVGYASAPACSGEVWRKTVRVARLRRANPGDCRELLRRYAGLMIGDLEMTTTTATTATQPVKKRSKCSARSLATIVRAIEAANKSACGTTDVDARIRRYVADHDAPADDAAAFARLCYVIFAQGKGFGPVDRQRSALDGAFDRFDPQAVARFDAARIAQLLELPIIRNEAKIRACIDNARRWVEFACETGTYLARVAATAAGDDAAAAWPALVAMLRADFVRLADTAARQTLKRWGFFTAFANPGAHRLLARLGFLNATASHAEVQKRIGTVAYADSRDPYALEGVLALFAGAGPCRAKPNCHDCALVERCPTGSAAMAPEAQPF